MKGMRLFYIININSQMIKKDFNKYFVASLKRTAANLSKELRDKEKLTKKIAEMQSDLERINQKIELYDAPIKLETGGYGVEDLVTKVVVNGVTRWELKYPETVIPYNAGGVVTEVNEPTFEPTPASDDSVTPTPAY